MGKRKHGSFVALVLLIALAVVAAACGGGGKSDKASKKRNTTTSERAARAAATGPVAPLTGLPDKSGVARKRPAITVKINNLPDIPQYGVDKADVVYEEVVEGGITRLAAIFNSQAPDRVGPVRSVRKTDHSIVWPIGGIFAYSGGAQYALDSINTAPVKQLDESRAGSLMFRESIDGNGAPYNLWAHVDEMFKETDVKPVPPPPLFTYRKPGAKPVGDVALAFTVGFLGGYHATFTWDKKTASWLRTRFDAPDVEHDGTRLAPKNVVVMFVAYTGGNSYGLQAEAQLTGTGVAWVFTDGRVIKARWTRADIDKPAKIINAKNQVIGLTPGQTWVELPDVGYAVSTFPPAPAT
jgi:Protein of unknown function (DUF3048) N-terminal domain/Protein of unknown function (DUF3048) C-terminal domain